MAAFFEGANRFEIGRKQISFSALEIALFGLILTTYMIK
jgi:hypothetical protein